MDSKLQDRVLIRAISSKRENMTCIKGKCSTTADSNMKHGISEGTEKKKASAKRTPDTFCKDRGRSPTQHPRVIAFLHPS
eukprot:1155235-Pelagomonas_calceolata.AAC.1